MARTVINGPDTTKLLQESGFGILLEDGSSYLLTEATPTGGGRTVISSRTVIGTTRGVIGSRTVI